MFKYFHNNSKGLSKYISSHNKQIAIHTTENKKKSLFQNGKMYWSIWIKVCSILLPEEENKVNIFVNSWEHLERILKLLFQGKIYTFWISTLDNIRVKLVFLMLLIFPLIGKLLLLVIINYKAALNVQKSTSSDDIALSALWA